MNMQKLDARKVLAIAEDGMALVAMLTNNRGVLNAGVTLAKTIRRGDLDAPGEDLTEIFAKEVADAIMREREAAQLRIKALEAELDEAYKDNAKKQAVIAAAVQAYDPRKSATLREFGRLGGALSRAVEELLADDEADEDDDSAECLTIVPAGRYGVFRKDPFGHEYRSNDCETRGVFLSRAAAEDAAQEHGKEVGLTYYVRELRADES
jgi:hypothetical protein